MSDYEIFSVRQKLIDQGEIDVYVYDQIPNELRVQFIFTMKEYLGTGYSLSSREYYEAIVYFLRKELGKIDLYGDNSRFIAKMSDIEELEYYILREINVNNIISVFEVVFRKMVLISKSNPREIAKVSKKIDYINKKFHQTGIGYQYVKDNNLYFKVSSMHLHKELIVPTLKLLNDPNFSGAESDFINAFENYRSGKNWEAIVGASKSLEATLKSICEFRKWKYDENHTTMSKLIELIFENEFIDKYWTNQLNSLRSLLESIPVVRNKKGAHSGSKPVEIPDSLVEYVLHFTASTITFLVKTNSEK